MKIKKRKMTREELNKRLEELSSRIEENKRSRTKEEKMKNLFRSLTVYALVIGILLIPVMIARNIRPSENLSADYSSQIKYSVHSNKSAPLTLSGGRVYAIVSEFAISNDGSTVPYNYGVDLRLSKSAGNAIFGEPCPVEYGYLCAPDNLDKVFYINSPGAAACERSASDILGVSHISSFERGKAYYAYSYDGVDFEIASPSAVREDKSQGGTPCQTLTVNGFMDYTEREATVHYYRIVRFIDLRSLDAIAEYTVDSVTFLYCVTPES